MNAIDTLLAAGQTYNILAPEIVGDYVEKINKACENPNGYTAGSLFLAKDPDEVQRLYKATALIASGQTLTEGTNCSRTKIGNELSTINSALSNEEITRAKNGAYNLCDSIISSQVKDGITITKYDDGSFELDGTNALGYGWIEYVSSVLKPSAGDYKLSTGNVVNTTNNKEISFHVVTLNAYGSIVSAIGEVQNGEKEKAFTLDYNGYVSIRYRIWIASGATLSHLRIYPTITLATDPNTTYQPYAMTNRELTESVKVSSGDIEAYKNGTDISFLKGSYVKINNMVIISGTWSGNVDPTKAILTMPAGLRPSAATNGSGMIYVNDWSGAVYVIDTFGVVKQAQTSASATSGSFTMVYTI